MFPTKEGRKAFAGYPGPRAPVRHGVPAAIAYYI